MFKNRPFAKKIHLRVSDDLFVNRIVTFGIEEYFIAFQNLLSCHTISWEKYFFLMVETEVFNLPRHPLILGIGTSSPACPPPGMLSSILK